MINNPHINRAAAIVILLGVYVAGVDSGTKAHHTATTCNDHKNAPVLLHNP
jgi:hypothetical protein